MNYLEPMLHIVASEFITDMVDNYSHINILPLYQLNTQIYVT